MDELLPGRGYRVELGYRRRGNAVHEPLAPRLRRWFPVDEHFDAGQAELGTLRIDQLLQRRPRRWRGQGTRLDLATQLPRIRERVVARLLIEAMGHVQGTHERIFDPAAEPGADRR